MPLGIMIVFLYTVLVTQKQFLDFFIVEQVMFSRIVKSCFEQDVDKLANVSLRL